MKESKTNTYPIQLIPWISTAEYSHRIELMSVKYGLDDSKKKSLVAIASDVFIWNLPLSRISEIAKVSLFFNTEESLLFARDFLGWLILPVAIFFKEDGIEILESYGGRIQDYPLPDNFGEIMDDTADLYDAENIKLWAEEIDLFDNGYSGGLVDGQSSKPADTHIAEDKIKDVYKNILTPGVEKRIKKLHDLYDKDSDDFTKEFYTAINSRSVDNVVASLWTLAERGKLLYLLSEDKKISSLLAKHLEKKFNHPTADNFSETKDEIGYLAYFLRHLLVDTLKISEAYAAALVVHLLNQQSSTTGVDIEMIAYGDITTNTFVWRNIVNKDNKLVLE